MNADIEEVGEKNNVSIKIYSSFPLLCKNASRNCQLPIRINSYTFGSNLNMNYDLFVVHENCKIGDTCKIFFT